MATRRHRTRGKIDKSSSATYPLDPNSLAEESRDKTVNPNSRRGGPHTGSKGRQDEIEGPRPEQKVLSTALSLLAARSRSEEQLRRRLTAKFGNMPEIDRCIAQLKDRGYINDSKLAENYAAHRTGAKAIGKARLGRELSRKLLSKEVIDSTLTRAFQSVSEEELIDRAIEKRVRSSGIPASPADRQRMFGHLVRLGFEYDLIIKKIRSLGPASDLEYPED